MGLIITKLGNDNVEVTSTVGTHVPYTLQPDLSVYRNKSNRIDGANAISVEKIRAIFSYEKVDQVVRKDGTIVSITDGDTLYDELKEFFFFISDGGGLTPGFDLFLPSNNTEPLNTANQLNGTSGGGSAISFVDLTGITLTSTVGTGTLLKVSDDLQWSVTGSIRKITVDDNGTTRIFSELESIDGFITSDDGVLLGTLNGTTWTPGVDTAISENTQVALRSWNSNGYFNGSNNMHIGNTTPIEGEVFEVKVNINNVSTSYVIFEVYNISEDLGLSIWSTGGNLNVNLYTSSGQIISSRESGIVLENKDYIASVTVVNSTTLILTINGVVTTGSGAAFTATTLNDDQVIGTRLNNSLGFTGVIYYVISDQTYGLSNDWLGATYVSKPITFVSPENPDNLTFDNRGEPIRRFELTNGYNFAGVEDQHLETSILDRDGANTDMLWLRLKSLEPQLIAGDDVWDLQLGATGKFEITFNGITLTSALTPLLNTAYFIYSVIDSGGICSLYIGDILTDPALDGVATQLGLSGVIPTAKMVYGNTATTGTSFNGYLTQLGHSPLENTLLNAVNDYDTTKAQAPSNINFPFTFPLTLP
ncbi:MAG: hypothetical protein COA36_16640 [Desulfotalea sp.]|nr:MAG: hypothetical protein COA36_16640 [Desulfotalea sp.]